MLCFGEGGWDLSHFGAMLLYELNRGGWASGA